jgi:hypothetical protein
LTNIGTFSLYAITLALIFSISSSFYLIPSKLRWSNAHSSKKALFAFPPDEKPFDWSNFTRPEAYILFTRGYKKKTPISSKDSVKFDLAKPITWLGILFFVPVFGSEFFFAISRGFICNLPAMPDLCQSVNVVGSG